MIARPDLPLDRWASTDVLAAVVDVEIAALLRRDPSKDEALLALAARRELEDRMHRHRWLAMETARKAGASWAEIAAAAGMDAPAARRLCEQTLARQKAFGFAEAHRARSWRPGAIGMSATSSRQSALTGAGHHVIDDARPVPSCYRPFPHPRPAFPQPPSPSIPSTSESVTRPPHLFHPGQTPLHRGCARWASPVEAGVR